MQDHPNEGTEEKDSGFPLTTGGNDGEAPAERPTELQRTRLPFALTDSDGIPDVAPVSFPTSPLVSFPTSPPMSFPTSPPMSFPTSLPVSFPTLPPVSFPTLPPVSFPTFVIGNPVS